VLKVNPQLSGRIPTKEQLTLFRHDNQYLDFLQELEELLSHVFDRQSHLTDPDISDAMFYATNGVLDSIMMIVRRAARLAITKNAQCIEKVDSADAFQRYGRLHQTGKGKDFNPFLIENFSL